MNMFFFIIGSLLLLLYAGMLLCGGKYDYMIEPLGGDDFPFRFTYCVGLRWIDIGGGKLKGTVGDKLRHDAGLIYTPQYAEFYARIILAQMLSFGHLSVALFWVLAGFFDAGMSGFLVLIGAVFGVYTMYYYYNHTGEKVRERTELCESEFPNAISKLALIVNSGVILRNAWEMTAAGKTGEFYTLMQESCDEMKNGMPEIDAIYNFGVAINSPDIKKFTSALIQSIERGGADLPIFLANQSAELWEHRRQTMLQKGKKAAGALLMPIALMFCGVMLIVIAAAMQSFSM